MSTTATDTSERGLENLIVASLTAAAGYEQGRPEDYDRDHAVAVPSSSPSQGNLGTDSLRRPRGIGGRRAGVADYQPLCQR